MIAQASGSATKTAVSLGTVKLTVVPMATGAVRVIGPVLVVDPVPRGRRFVNGIALNQVPDPATGGEVIQVVVNGVLDSTQPLTTDLTLIQVFGSKTNDVITVDPSVTVPTTINGGTGGGKNILRGGGGPTIQNGWFGHTLLVGGTGAKRARRPEGPRPLPAQHRDGADLRRQRQSGQEPPSADPDGRHLLPLRQGAPGPRLTARS